MAISEVNKLLSQALCQIDDGHCDVTLRLKIILSYDPGFADKTRDGPSFPKSMWLYVVDLRVLYYAQLTIILKVSTSV